MPRASMRLTGTAAGDLRRPWRASSAVSCESRGGFVVLIRQSTAEGASQSGGLVSSFFSFLFLEGVAMSEEWDEVVHEVNLMVNRLWAFRDDLSSAENSGALTALQSEFVNVIRASALATAVCIEQYMLNALERKAAKDGATE